MLTNSGERIIEGSDLLVAAGRRPNTGGIGLDIAGVALDDRGYIKVNERLETSAPTFGRSANALGARNSPMCRSTISASFGTTSQAETAPRANGGFRIACSRTPPLARVGLNEIEGQPRGVPVRVAKMPTSAVLRTRTIDERQGFMKALVAADDDRMLGFAMIGAEAGDVAAAVQTAMLAGMPYTGLRDAILTMAEGLNALFSKVPSRATR